MSKTDRSLSGFFGVPEIKSFGISDDEPDVMVPSVVENTSVAVEPTTSTALVVGGGSAQIDNDTEFVKQKLKSLLKRGEDALDSLIEIAKDEERASHFEAIAGMINQLSGVANNILDAEGKRQKLKAGLGEEVPAGGSTVTNNTQIVFNGTTAELQAMLYKNEYVDDDDAIEVEAKFKKDEDE